mgnify:CR=1 FL=1
MKPAPPSFDWSHARAFLATVDMGTFSAAARQLGLTQPTLGHQVAALEDELGVLLFERLGRSLALTEAGRDLAEHIRDMQAAADRAALMAQGHSQAIEGNVRITASDVMSAFVLPPLLSELRKQAPKLGVELIAANDIRDLMRREADIAIRHVQPDQPDLIARKLKDGAARFYASRDFLASRGRPEDAAGLAAYDHVHFGQPGWMVDHLRPLGIPVEDSNFPFGSENGVVAWELARQGLGIAIMWDRVGDSYEDMERVLPDMAPLAFPVWLTTHRELHTSRRIRLVFDALAAFLA